MAIKMQCVQKARLPNCETESGSFLRLIAIHQVGDASRIADRSILSTPLGDDEVELQVKATGVNFRDIMASMASIGNKMQCVQKARLPNCETESGSFLRLIAIHQATPLGDDEVELQVKATGVNFRDIMASMGLVPVRD
jgi:NADPH:quinone reductase-like Zn-dependent oxidoreductase